MNQKIEKLHQFVLKMPRFLEKIVAAILLVGVTYSCVQLGLHVLAFSDLEFNVYVEDILLTAFNAIIVIELIRIACIATLLLCRKYLFYEFDFQEEE